MQTNPVSTNLTIASVRRQPSVPASELTPRALTPPYEIQHLAVHTAEGIFILPHEDIVRCEALGNYCHIHCVSGKKILVSRTLKRLEALLPKADFIRVHQTHLIRLAEIRQVQKEQVCLADQTSLPLSRHHRPELLRRLETYTVKI
jgi:DNA-binding LytR/AlgR family response regulator